MTCITRRIFLSGTAATLACPAVVTAQPVSNIDVAVIGAGAAGIAAARRLAAGGLKVAVLEAADHIGGRCVTDTRTFGVPYDRGAHWIHMPDSNPVAKLAASAGLDVAPAPPGQRLRIGRRNARESEVEDFLSNLVRANRAIIDAGRSGKADVACMQALPKELADWRPTISFALGPYASARDLADLSAQDFARYGDRNENAFCRQGYGALVAALGRAVPVQLSTPVSRIIWDGRAGIEIVTGKGVLRARAAIITISTGVLGSDAIRFAPELPKRLIDAVARLKPGSFDHIALELPGNPLGLQRDDLVFEKSGDEKTAAMLANVSGTDLCMIDVGGSFGAGLAGQGEAAMIAFASDWLASLFGADVKKAIQRSHATRWNDDPLIRGAWSSAAPGGQPSRRILMEPLRDRLWFAGEAAHETAWGTVGGAWESGDRAAGEVLARLRPMRNTAPPAKKTPQRRPQSIMRPETRRAR